jgi:hypothetical protein
MMPSEFDSEEHALPQRVTALRPRYRWYQKAAGVCFAALCLAIGLFLLIFPWTEGWDSNYFAGLVPEWRQYWDNLYVRGAVSGVGAVNLWISFLEMFRLKRFANRS